MYVCTNDLFITQPPGHLDRRLSNLWHLAFRQAHYQRDEQVRGGATPRVGVIDRDANATACRPDQFTDRCHKIKAGTKSIPKKNKNIKGVERVSESKRKGSYCHQALCCFVRHSFGTRLILFVYSCLSGHSCRHYLRNTIGDLWV